MKHTERLGGLMTPPEPITALESLAQIRFFFWDAIYAFNQWNKADYLRTRALYDAFNERKHVVGKKQAMKDYYG